MRIAGLFVIILALACWITVAALNAEPTVPEEPEEPTPQGAPEKPAEPETPADKSVTKADKPAKDEKPAEPETPEPEPDPDAGKVVVYLDIKDYVDGEVYKYRVVEYMVKRTFDLANPEKEEQFKDEWRKRYDWSKFSKKEKEAKLNKDYKDMRKEKGVQNLKITHLKVIQWRPKPKPKKVVQKEDKKDEPEEGDEGDEEPAEEPEKPAKPEWVDPRDTADYIIEGYAKFKKGKVTKYFGESVEWQSVAECDIKVVRRIDMKVVKELKKKDYRRGDTRGQDVAHNRCMRNLGQEIATAIVKMSEFRKK